MSNDNVLEQKDPRELVEEKLKSSASNRFPASVVRDAVHDIIDIEYDFVLDIIDSEPFQRLRRIKQLGAAYLVFPCAEHTRFCHSLGAYHLAGRFLDQIGNVRDYDKQVVRVAALLHDVGHGPFSHLFERTLKKANYDHRKGHESWTKRIILEHPRIAGVLDDLGPKVKQDVGSIIDGTYEPKHLCSIVSSQLDVDRFDYTIRDSMLTGVNYGRFDLNWMLKNLKLDKTPFMDEDNGKLVVKDRIVLDARRNMSTIEEFLLGNLNLYEHVCFHRTVLAAEEMLIAALLRAIELLGKGEKIIVYHPVLKKIADNEPMALDEYLSLDDGVVLSWIREWRNDKDPILKDLTERFWSRRLFKAIDAEGLSGPQFSDAEKDITGILTKKKLDPEYYLLRAESNRPGYKGVEADEIFVKQGGDGPIKYSEIIKKKGHEVSKAIVGRLEASKTYFIVPDDVKSEVEEIVEKAKS